MIPVKKAFVEKDVRSLLFEKQEGNEIDGIV